MPGETVACGTHCLVVTYPTQGHINPMLEFSRRLEHKGIKVTLVLTRFILDRLQKSSKSVSTGTIAVDTISDGKEDDNQVLNGEDNADRFRCIGSSSLSELVEKYRSSNSPVNCIVYDSFIPWALDVAKKYELFGAVFFTQSCAVGIIYNYLLQGKLSLPLSGSSLAIPGLPILEASDMPSFISDQDSYPGAAQKIAAQFSNVDKADFVLFNTFYKLEEKEANEMANLFPLKTIGPTLPSFYLDKQIQGDKEYGVNIHTPETDVCIEWLNQRSQGSVVFVSFGSIAALTIEQMEELARGLRGSQTYFLWVVRISEEDKLPKDFVKETSEKGLVVSWCPQLEVLAHHAIGCFVTHCGWNSTLEAISLGVPMVAIPHWSDQSTNAKYVADVWENGVRARTDTNGIISAEELERCLKEVMEGEKGLQIRSNAGKWKQLALEAVDNGGSSSENVNQFVSELVAKTS